MIRNLFILLGLILITTLTTCHEESTCMDCYKTITIYKKGILDTTLYDTVRACEEYLRTINGKTLEFRDIVNDTMIKELTFTKCK